MILLSHSKSTLVPNKGEIVPNFLWVAANLLILLVSWFDFVDPPKGRPLLDPPLSEWCLVVGLSLGGGVAMATIFFDHKVLRNNRFWVSQCGNKVC
mgnify:CR=1 FL=1